MRVGDKIRTARIAKGMTQEELGHFIGVEKSAVAKYESGRVKNLKKETLKKLSTVLDISILELIEEDEEQKAIETENENNPLLDSRTIFSQNLRFLVAKAGKTRKEVSEDIAVSYSTFSDWCTGKKYPRVEKLEALSKYFGITVPELVGEKKEETPKSETVDIGKEAVLDIILRLHTDNEFFQIVEKMSELERNKLNALQQFLKAFGK